MNEGCTAVYIRISADGPTEAEQRSECLLTATARGWRPAVEFLNTEAADGSPGNAYRALLVAIRNRQVGRVVAYSAERMFPTNQTMLQVLDFVRAGGAVLYFSRDNLGTEGQVGAALLLAMRLIGDLATKRRLEKVRVIKRAREHQARQRGEPIRWGRPRCVDQETERTIARLLDQGVSINKTAQSVGVDRGVVRYRRKQRARMAEAGE